MPDRHSSLAGTCTAPAKSDSRHTAITASSNTPWTIKFLVVAGHLLLYWASLLYADVRIGLSPRQSNADPDEGADRRNVIDDSAFPYGRNVGPANTVQELLRCCAGIAHAGDDDDLRVPLDHFFGVDARIWVGNLVGYVDPARLGDTSSRNEVPPTVVRGLSDISTNTLGRE